MTKDELPPTVDELDLAYALAKAREAGLIAFKKEPRINYVYLHETMFQSISRDIVTVGCLAGLGVFSYWLGTSIIEWFSIVIVIIMLIQGRSRYKKCKTIAEARAELDRIEKEGTI